MIPTLKARETALVVGAGPAGLEAALTLARRGIEVSLVERDGELGGRLRWERRLQGARGLDRVREHRIYPLDRMANLQVFRGSPLDADDIIDYGAQRVFLATGSRWRFDGVGPATPHGIPGLNETSDGWALTPEQVGERVLAGQRIAGPCRRL